MRRIIIIISAFLLPAIASAQNITIGEATIRFNDTLRKRPLITEVWYPTTDSMQKHNTGFVPFPRMETVKDGKIANKKYPLIMISHGTGGGRLTLEWLADILVQNGFMVAAVDHWGNTYDNKIAIDFVTPWQRPRDISFVLTQLLNDPKFGPEIDQDKIGAAGFSIGGYTTIALAGGVLSFDALKNFTNSPQGQKEANIPEFPGLMEVIKTGKPDESFKNSPQHLKDKRIKAFFAICPAVGQGFADKSQVKEIDKPLYIVEVEGDSITPYKTNAEHYHDLIPASKYLLIKGKANHYVFLGEATDPVKKEAPVYFMDDTSVDRHAIHQQVGQMAANFFKENLK
ncbi:dienelactone hydrolase family protein [Mucilaginibacter sp. BT774]|uniref:alpha/beta hydrolase family protein n=1 Tax=Mucilaginibacter sp. BT774 TaxID=3062276 RepID=UPI0026745AB2|nr:dienelactone hydrolase family protein [Mucilaginibacter sp. BT774]MDO3625464.1 dienelactone hydrolase family protein [Mucilaginibacter sp. BT774]